MSGWSRRASRSATTSGVSWAIEQSKAFARPACATTRGSADPFNEDHDEAAPLAFGKTWRRLGRQHSCNARDGLFWRLDHSSSVSADDTDCLQENLDGKRQTSERKPSGQVPQDAAVALQMQLHPAARRAVALCDGDDVARIARPDQVAATEIERQVARGQHPDRSARAKHERNRRQRRPEIKRLEIDARASPSAGACIMRACLPQPDIWLYRAISGMTRKYLHTQRQRAILTKLS